MTTLLFVHGTGVREEGYNRSFTVVQRMVHRYLPGVRVEPCLWGETLGATLRDDGASVPTFDSAGIDPGGGQQQMREREAVRWNLLYQDPLYELRSLSAMARDDEQDEDDAAGGPRQALPYTAESLLRTLQAPELSAALLARLADAGHDPVVIAPRAASKLADDPVIDDALASPALADAQTRRLPIARAFVAAWVNVARADGLSTLSGELRDALHDDVVAKTLGGAVKGVKDQALKLVKGLGAWVGTKVAVRKRTALTDASFPVAADVLRYQADGAGMREFIRTRIEQVARTDEQVVVLAHSLGGIASFELLAAADAPRVTALVTVGSQAPFLYEVDALATFRHGRRLRADFPRWLNVYDLNDMLSYVAQPLFSDHAVDLEVASREPFPSSHSAYWTNDRLWKELKAFLG